jgi:hypothetical protein
MAPTQIENNRTGLRRMAPRESIQSQPWAFLGLALAVGVGTGLLLRYKGLRKALGIYLAVRRFV